MQNTRKSGKNYFDFTYFCPFKSGDSFSPTLVLGSKTQKESPSEKKIIKKKKINKIKTKKNLSKNVIEST